MRIGILTGGGDVPGLNPCIKAVVNRVNEEGHEVIGIRRGWGGLLNANPDDPPTMADNFIASRPRTRCAPSTAPAAPSSTPRAPTPGKVRSSEVPDFLADQAVGDGPHDFTPHVLRVLEAQGIDVLIPIGGDDTLSYGLRMHEEDVPVIAIPKTMDNDVHGTDYCIGFSTAVTRGVQFIHNLRTSTGSHERIAVVELFGRYSGETSLITAYLAGVDRAIISEVPFDIDRLAEFPHRRPEAQPVPLRHDDDLRGRLHRGRRHGPDRRRRCVRPPQAGRHRPADRRAPEGARPGPDIIYQQVGYLMRSGSPDSLDLMVATNYAVMAADLALDGSTGTDGGAARRYLHPCPDLGDERRREARRHRRAVRRQCLPAEGASRHRQTDVPVLS